MDNEGMNAKKTGWLFLIAICIYIGGSFTLRHFKVNMPLIPSLFLSEALLWIPTLLVLMVQKVNPIKFCRFKKIHISSALMTILFTFLIMPAATLMNVISMFFVENTISQMSGEILQEGFPIMFFMVALHAPFAEEFIVRGSIFQGLKKSASPLKAILLSAFLFGLIHLNLNQAGYAFVLGIGMALLVEATDSIWASFICHMTVNARSVIAMFMAGKVSGFYDGILGNNQVSEQLQEALNGGVSKEQLLMMLCLEILLVVVCVPIAGCVLVWIAKKEGTSTNIKSLWKERKQGKVFSFPMIIGILISTGFLIYLML